MTKSLGPLRTCVTKWSPALSRLRYSRSVITCGLTSRPIHSDTAAISVVSFLNPKSPSTMRSTSLSATAPPLATDASSLPLWRCRGCFSPQIGPPLARSCSLGLSAEGIDHSSVAKAEGSRIAGTKRLAPAFPSPSTLKMQSDGSRVFAGQRFRGGDSLLVRHPGREFSQESVSQQRNRGPRAASSVQAPQHFLYFLPLPHGQGAFRPTAFGEPFFPSSCRRLRACICGPIRVIS